MYSKVLHTIIALLLVVTFQLPTWIQFEHSFQDHEHIHICDATGSTKHIHQKSDNHCRLLHQPVNYNFTFDSILFDFSYKIDQYRIHSLLVSKLPLQKVIFTSLRGPPSLF